MVVSLSGFRLDHDTTVIMAAGSTDVVWALGFAAVRAFNGIGC